MKILLTTLLIAISLSMDAFSLALIYGTLNINKKDKIVLSIIVGIYHFIMPLLGLSTSLFATKHLVFDLKYLVSIIFIIIGLELSLSSKKEKEIVPLKNIVSFLVFGLSVSIDSFTTGIGLNIINNNYLLTSTIFLLTSSIFTYIGLNIGDKLNQKYGKISTICGGIILIIIGLSYLF